MWRTPDGRLNTVALPDPAAALGERVVGHLRLLATGLGPPATASLIESERERLYTDRDGPWDQGVEDGFKHVPPTWALDKVPLDPDARTYLRNLMEAATPRFALDLLDAV